MGVYTNRIIDKMSERHLNWGKDFVAALADLERIPGASQGQLSKAFRNLVELDDVKTAVPLDQLLGRFIKMTEAFKPFKLQFDDPAQALHLLKDYEAGRLTVSVQHQEPGSLIHGVHVIEQVGSGQLFAGVRDGSVRWSTQGVPIHNEQIATAAANTLRDMGHGPCRVVDARMRTTEPQIAKSLLDLGFVVEEAAHAH